jgi:uncharacterized tellurite resistance protein B-like protein
VVFGRWSKAAAADADGHALSQAVRSSLPDADDETVKIVTAVAGLLGGVAYADRDYTEAEARELEDGLSRIHGLVPAGVRAVMHAVTDHMLDIATVQAPRYCRVLREHADRDLRLEVLDMLVSIAAADGVISHDEVTLLRNTTTALGLTQADYNDAQSAHRDKLSSRR